MLLSLRLLKFSKEHKRNKYFLLISSSMLGIEQRASAEESEFLGNFSAEVCCIASARHATHRH